MKKIISFFVVLINIWIICSVSAFAFETVVVTEVRNIDVATDAEQYENEKKRKGINTPVEKEVNTPTERKNGYVTVPLNGNKTYSEKEIKVYIDEKGVDFDVPPQIIGGRTMVPLRAIFEAIGAEVKWDEATKKITIQKDNKKYSMTIGDNIISIGNSFVIMDTYPAIVDNRTLVPVRFIAECLGYTVNWDDSNKVVKIDTKTQSETNLYKVYVNDNFAMLYSDDLIIDESYMNEDIVFMNNEDYNIPGEKEIISISGIDYNGSDFYNIVEKWKSHLTYDRKAHIISKEQSKIKGCTLYKINYIDEGDYITSCFIEGGKKAYNISFISDNQEKFKDEIDKILSTFNIL